MSKLIGIIGGMGPMASQLFYKMVTDMTEAGRDQEHLNMIIYSDASMPDRTSAILKGDYKQVHDQLLADARVLEQSGCEAIGITCNTAHFFADMIKDEIHIPIIHMIQETAEKVAEKAKGEKVAVLATDGTIKTELYQKRLEQAGVIPFILPEDMQKLVMYEIYDRVKNGQPCDEEKWNEIDQFIRNAGCKKAILACTELSVIKEEIHLDDFYIDPMSVLAAKVIEFSGKKLK
ncbi:cysteate racemase [Aminipila luticellarii]|uniref:Amino acid racemase n=1 Tax=Aminipila luticellarii TaxID=2507160 RepID=A0A410PVL0_9FIRM|nr:amino acid racemase [Aminipila luticellarii]QAT42982.1 amino acid racemase [Aminipila luticellarii]